MLGYLFIRITAFIFKYLPFRVIYALSDGLAYLLRVVFKYRLDVVRKNLHYSKLNITEDHRSEFEKAIYLNLSDILVEGIKGMYLPIDKLVERYEMVNSSILEPYYSKGQSIVMVAAHFGNFEWGVRSSAAQVNHRVVGVYKPMKNRRIDRFIQKIRAKDHTVLVSMQNAWVEFENRDNHINAYALIFDQNPGNLEKAHWVNFMGIPTAVIHGPEHYSKKYNLPVFFAHIDRIRRGHYRIEFENITDHPRSFRDGELSFLLMQKLEIDIHKSPANWLWTHKRWKHDQPKNKVVIDSVKMD